MTKITSFKKVDFNHHLPLQLRFNDIDGFNHVNNSRIQEFCDLGRMHYLQKVLGWMPVASSNNNQLVVVSIKTNFLKQILLNQEIEVLTKVFALGNKSLTMTQWIIEVGSSEPMAVCESVMSGFLRKEGRSFVLPDEWRNQIKAFEGTVKEKKVAK